MMYINSNSKQHKKQHTLMCEKIYNAILEENPKLADAPDILKAAVHRINEPEIISNEKDEISRIVRYAAYYSGDVPYHVIILTTEEKKQGYEKNKHYIGLKKVSIKAGKDALEVINFYFKQCMGDKDYY